MKKTYRAYRLYLDSDNEMHNKLIKYLDQYPLRSRGQAIIEALNNYINNRGSPDVIKQNEIIVEALHGVVNRIETIEKRLSNETTINVEEDFLRKKFKNDTED